MCDDTIIPNGMHQAKANVLATLATLELGFIAFNVYDKSSGSWTLIGALSVVCMIAALGFTGRGYWLALDRYDELRSFDNTVKAIKLSLVTGGLSISLLVTSHIVASPTGRIDRAIDDRLP